MKILHISKYYPPYRGGIEDICFSIIQGLKSGNEQKVVCFNDTHSDLTSEVEGIEVMRAGIIYELASQPLSFSLYRILKHCLNTFHPDVVHLHLPNPLACIYLLHLISPNTKLIIHWHSDIVAQRIIYKFFIKIEKLILKRADKILVTSSQYLNYSKPLIPFKSKTIVIPNIVSLSKLNIEEDSKDRINALKFIYGNKKIVFFMGRHVPYKGIEYLIKAEKYITSDCIILIAGSGPLTNLLKRETHSNRVKFIGKIPDDLIKIYMNAADIFAFPSITKNEAFGVVLAEAMYCKAVPVTFTIKGSGVNWVSLNNVTGFEVENKNAKAFGEAIDTLLKDDKKRMYFAKNAHNRVTELFTIQTVSKKLEAVYNSFII